MKCRVVNSKDVLKIKRFDGSYHNADVNIYNDVITSHSVHNLKYYCSSIFTPSRNKRIYTEPEFGVPFLSNADVSAQDPLLSCKYSSKKYSFDETAVLKGGMILTGRVGAIGQTTFVPKYWERYNAMGSDNIIRIVVKPEYRNGFLYAYLASKFGNLLFWKHVTGGVQPFITEAMVGNFPIPRFPESFQKEVDDLIQESATLRERATDALDKAHDVIERQFPSYNIEKIGKVGIKEVISSSGKRLEAAYHQSVGKQLDAFIKKNFTWKPLSEVAHVSRPGLFKRNYVDNGLMFFGCTDLFLATPQSKKFVSRTNTPDISGLTLKEGMILIPRSGTIGDVAFATSQHASKLASEHVIRLLPNNTLKAGYIFAFLSTSTGRSLIQRYIFGSVIQHVEPHLLNEIPIPILEDIEIDKIDQLATLYKDCLGKAGELELQAIRMVEEEIEKWNK